MDRTLDESAVTHIGADYSLEEVEYLRAIASWRNRHQRIPDLVDGFRVAKELGWRKIREGKE